MASSSVSANTQAWLKERFGSRQRVNFSKQTILTSNQWLRLADEVQRHSSECLEIYQSAGCHELGLERLAAVLALQGVRPVNPQVLEASSMVMKVLKG